jgi:hypothetical protein
MSLDIDFTGQSKDEKLYGELYFILWKLGIIEEADADPDKALSTLVKIRTIEHHIRLSTSMIMTDLERQMFEYDE